jgi:hypothetical protein
VATLVAVMTVVGLATLALVQPAAAADTPPVSVALHGRGGRGLCGQTGLAAAAEALGMTADELSTQLWAGESLADLAEAAGVDLADLQAAVTAACQQATRDAVEQAVTDGTLTRAHADWLLEGLDQGFWGGDGGGLGFGPRGFGPGRGGFERAPFGDTTPPATTTPGSDS